MIGRNHHKLLNWEKRRMIERNYQIQVLSDALYDIQKVIGAERLQKVSYTWGSGITFSGLTKEEFNNIKILLPRLGKLDKNSNEYGLNLKGRFGESEINGWMVHVTVDFKWGLPDSCVLEYKVGVEEADPDSYFVGIDGKVKHKTRKTVVNCDKPMLESVFSG